MHSTLRYLLALLLACVVVHSSEAQVEPWDNAIAIAGDLLIVANFTDGKQTRTVPRHSSSSRSGKSSKSKSSKTKSSKSSKSNESSKSSKSGSTRSSDSSGSTGNTGKGPGSQTESSDSSSKSSTSDRTESSSSSDSTESDRPSSSSRSDSTRNPSKTSESDDSKSKSEKKDEPSKDSEDATKHTEDVSDDSEDEHEKQSKDSEDTPSDTWNPSPDSEDVSNDTGDTFEESQEESKKPVASPIREPTSAPTISDENNKDNIFDPPTLPPTYEPTPTPKCELNSLGAYGGISSDRREYEFFYQVETTSDVTQSILTNELLGEIEREMGTRIVASLFDECGGDQRMLQDGSASCESIGFSRLPVDRALAGVPCLPGSRQNDANTCYAIDGGVRLYVDGDCSNADSAAMAAIRDAVESGGYDRIDPRIVNVIYLDISGINFDQEKGSSSSTKVPGWAIVVLTIVSLGLVVSLLLYLGRRRPQDKNGFYTIPDDEGDGEDF